MSVQNSSDFQSPYAAEGYIELMGEPIVPVAPAVPEPMQRAHPLQCVELNDYEQRCQEIGNECIPCGLSMQNTQTKCNPSCWMMLVGGMVSMSYFMCTSPNLMPLGCKVCCLSSLKILGISMASGVATSGATLATGACCYATGKCCLQASKKSVDARVAEAARERTLSGALFTPSFESPPALPLGGQGSNSGCLNFGQIICDFAGDEPAGYKSDGSDSDDESDAGDYNRDLRMIFSDNVSALEERMRPAHYEAMFNHDHEGEHAAAIARTIADENDSDSD